MAWVASRLVLYFAIPDSNRTWDTCIGGGLSKALLAGHRNAVNEVFAGDQVLLCLAIEDSRSLWNSGKPVRGNTFDRSGHRAICTLQQTLSRVQNQRCCQLLASLQHPRSDRPARSGSSR